MNHTKIKLLIGGLVLAGAVGYLAFAGASKGWVYYLEVDEYVAEATYREQRVRLAGRVADAGVEARPADLRAAFDLRGQSAAVPVVYQGVVPDNFKPGCEVVVEGRLDEAGVFRADLMMTKCASKYQAEDHAERLGDPS
jgi:cytochrome c-type biogenesis protein CcmE